MTATQENINDEFTKNPELKKKDLQELKCWLGTQMHLPSISGSIKFLYFSHVESRKSVNKGQSMMQITVDIIISCTVYELNEQPVLLFQH